MTYDEACILIGVSDHEVKTDLKSVEKKFRRLMMKHHPDKGGDSEVASRLNNAIEIIRCGFGDEVNYPEVELDFQHVSNLRFVPDGSGCIVGGPGGFILSRTDIISLFKGEQVMCSGYRMSINVHSSGSFRCVIDPSSKKYVLVNVVNGIITTSGLHNYDCLFVVLASNSENGTGRLVISWKTFRDIMSNMGVEFKESFFKLSI